MKKKIVIIGGSGFIGHNLSIFLKKKGLNVYVVDNLGVNNLNSIKYEHKDKKKIKIYQNFLKERIKLLKQHKISMSKIDAKNFSKLKRYIQKIKPDTIVHLAAVSHADRSNKNPKKTFDNSFVTLQNALEASKNFKPHFIFFSSSMVYGDFKKNSVNEKSNCNQRNLWYFKILF